MAARGLKSGRCGGGQAGVLRGRVGGSSAFPAGRRKPERTGTGVTVDGYSREAPTAAQGSMLGLGEVLGRKPTPFAPLGSASAAHRGAGPKLNFAPACAASQRLRSPGAAGAKGGGEPGEPGPGRLSCRPRQKGRRDPRRLRSAKPGSTGLSGRDAARRAPRDPFGGGQLPAAAAPAAPGSASPALGPQPGSPQPADCRPSGAPTNFLLPGPSGRAGSFPARLSRSPGCRRPRPARRASSLPLCNPEPRAPSGPRAAAPTKPAARRRRGEGLGVAAGAAEPGGGNPPPGEGGGKRQRGRGGQRRGKKVSCSRRERPAFLSAPPARARPPVPVAVGGDRGGGRGDAVAWRASRSPYLCPE